MPTRLPNLTASLSRRAFAGAAAAATAALAGCGGSAPQPSGFAGTPAASPEPGGVPGRWSGRTITVATYGGEVEAALRSLVWEPFERATGCRIRAFANDPVLPGTPTPVAPTDLVLADPVTAARFIEAGEGQALDLEVVPGLRADQARAAAGAAPAFAYSLVDCWKRDAFPAGRAPADWPAWWNVQQIPGPRTMRRHPLGTFEIALLAAGAEPGSLYPLDIDRALASLDRIVESVGERWWTRGIEPAGWIAADRAILGAAWHHRVIAAQWDGKAVDLGWNQGIQVTDCWLAPASSREPEAAADLLAWTLSPEAQAAFARQTRMGPVNPDALAMIEPWLLDTIPTAEPQASAQIMLDGAWWAAYGQAAELAMEAWLAGGASARPGAADAP